ncbi:hypothetical protein [Sporomusa termitida]|uniref:Uncharacterized protein n=1 Tax=Sporomusa termitida TaxID=2377 RepID=A0A517DUY3_9FIRM|nr:hypothetical protein [Sporomusa termitida]QDR81172.1 hypothetical protein SPTER_25450 [Sporomusa termitida]
MIKDYSFSALPAAIPVWTPSPQKSINLTAAQVSNPLAATIILSSNGDKSFLALRTTESSPTIVQSFPSAYRLSSGDTIFARTADEGERCENFGAATATQVAFNSRSDFSNVNNAAGMADGQVAALSSGLLIGTRGRIVLSYNMSLAALEQLQLESVIIKFYCRLALTLAVGTSTMIFYWRPNSADNWIELQQASLSLLGTLDYLTSPLEQDITAQILTAANPWEVINNLQTSFVGSHTGLGIGNTIQLDAVEVEICVTGLNQLTLFGFET